MNAPVRLPPLSLNDLENLAEDFAESCRIQAWCVAEGWIPKRQAVDNLQNLIEAWQVPDEDRDAAQAIMAEAFAPIEQQPCELCGLKVDQHRRVDTDQGPEFYCDEQVVEPLPDNYAAQIVRQWEMADKRDRWRHTGELPPKPTAETWPPKQPCRTPQATIEAFLWTASYQSPECLANWLEQHSRDAATCREIWSKKCTAR